MSAIEAPTPLQLLMHAVLDGEATPEEVRALQSALAADPGASEEFANLQQLFRDLADLPQPHAPEPLVASVGRALPAYSASGQRAATAGDRDAIQPSAGWRVFRSKAAREGRPSFPWIQRWSNDMSQRTSIFSNRKTWIGAGVAALAAVVVVQFGSDGYPTKQDVAGTVVPAQRYRAAQDAGELKLGDQSVAQLMQNDAFVRMINDPQVQALVRDPDFQAAAKAMLQSPDAAKALLANPEAARGMLQDAEAARNVAANAEAAKLLQKQPELAFFVRANREATRVLLANTEAARQLYRNPELGKLLLASPAAAREVLMQSSPEAGQSVRMQSSPEAGAKVLPN